MKNTKKLIFLVDDDLFYLNIFKQLLMNLGYKNILIFKSARDCMEHLYLKPSIVFTDYYMGDTTGLDLLKRIKTHNQSIKVVLMSSDDNEKIRIQAKAYGAEDFIQKANSPAEHMQRITKHLVGSRWSNFLKKFRFFFKRIKLAKKLVYVESESSRFTLA